MSAKRIRPFDSNRSRFTQRIESPVYSNENRRYATTRLHSLQGHHASNRLFEAGKRVPFSGKNSARPHSDPTGTQSDIAAWKNQHEQQHQIFRLAAFHFAIKCCYFTSGSRDREGEKIISAPREIDVEKRMQKLTMAKE